MCPGRTRGTRFVVKAVKHTYEKTLRSKNLVRVRDGAPKASYSVDDSDQGNTENDPARHERETPYVNRMG